MVKRVSLVMPTGLWEQIEVVASVEDKLPSEVIREAIRYYFEEEIDFEDYMADYGPEEDGEEETEEEEVVKEE